VVLGVMNVSGYAVNAWLPLLTYPTVDAPRFRKGFVFSVVAFSAQFGITGLVAHWQGWEGGARWVRWGMWVVAWMCCIIRSDKVSFTFASNP
jgi:hypothetical protein